MAVSLLAREISDLCLGKPALRSLSVSSTIGDALLALKTSDDNFISVWCCEHSSSSTSSDDDDDVDDCRCVGKICMVDIICFLCREENLKSPSSALKSPITLLLNKSSQGLVKHVDPHSSLQEVIDEIIQGTQNIVVPIKAKHRRKLLSKPLLGPTHHHKGREYCWLTQEDIVRYLLSSIALFSPIASLSVDSLNIIDDQILSVNYHSLASSTIDAIARSLLRQTSVAVVDDDGILIGEISPFTLSCCDESVAAAIATLSTGDLMAYIDCGGPPEEIVKLVKERLKERNLGGMIELENFGSNSNSSSDDEVSATNKKVTKLSRCNSYSSRMMRRAEAIVCHPKSSLVAVMIQAIAHRVNYVWVIEDDCSLVGIVTFRNILKIFREHLEFLV
ncbi:CBS domain [Dillenia turbinata]|uniref:CBS domain n=1 Tax=Dillenia turbinata TaxID=194707 RepID=A0AAN8VFW7_9MAGN